MNKKFVVTGVPRSGTSFMCKTLSKLDNVYMDQSYNFEPFSYSGFVLNEAAHLNELEKNHPNKIVGFKTFFGDSFLLSKHLESYTPIVMIRKDVRKAFLSLLILSKLGPDENFSSKKAKGAESIEFNPRGLDYYSRLILKWYYYSEQIENGFKVYFEDMVEGNQFPELESFFENKIDLDPSYSESDITSYYPDPDRWLDPLKKIAISMGADNFPDYFRENLHI